MSASALRLVEKDIVDRSKALDAAVTQIERAFGKGSIMKLGQQDVVEADVISTGSSYSLRDIVNKAFLFSGLGDASHFIEQNTKELRPNEIKYSYLDPSKAKRELNWENPFSIDIMIKKLLKEELF